MKVALRRLQQQQQHLPLPPPHLYALPSAPPYCPFPPLLSHCRPTPIFLCWSLSLHG